MYFEYVIEFIFFLFFLYKKNKWRLHTTTQKRSFLKHPNLFLRAPWKFPVSHSGNSIRDVEG